MKLQLNLSNYDLGFRFSVCETTVGRILKKWIVAMDIRLSPLIAWPDRNSVQKTMPYSFRRNYGLSVISIIDCFEIFIEKPSNLLAKSCTWSSYKHYNTAKYLISITPQGVINFISRGWGGRSEYSFPISPFPVSHFSVSRSSFYNYPFDRVKRSLIKKSREPYKAMRAYHRSRTSSFYVSRLFPVLFCIFDDVFVPVPLQLLLSGSLMWQPGQ